MTAPLPAVRRLSHVCLGATDVPRTVRFYADLLGATVVHEFRSPENLLYGVFLAVGGDSFLEFFLQREAVPPGGLFRHFCFQVEDIEAMAAHAATLGFTPEIRRSRSDGVLQFWVSDPDDNAIEFHQYDEQSAHYPFLKDRGPTGAG